MERTVVYTVTKYFCLKCGERADVYDWGLGKDIVCHCCKKELVIGEFKIVVQTIKKTIDEGGF